MKLGKHCSNFLRPCKSIQFKFTQSIIKKAECFNFSEPAVNLIKAFLKERSQCVKIGIEVSEHIFVTQGVSQGTVLGPFNFLLYVYDFSKKSKVSLSLFSLQMILVFCIEMKQEKHLQQKLNMFF